MELGGNLKDDQFAGYVVDDSDLEYSDCSRESSDNESFQKISNTELVISSEPHRSTAVDIEDEFEREMEAEANLLISNLLKQKTHQVLPSSHGLEKEESTSGTHPSSTATSKEKESGEFYDEIYFDSSSGEEASQRTETKSKKKRKKVRKLTNDELLYDPHLDEEDERWVQRQRKAYHNVKKLDKRNKTKTVKDKIESSEGGGAVSSDAILNCPACMSTLCLDCQRHDVYQNQFRAMFVLNCTVVKDEVLHYKTKPDKRRRQREEPHPHLPNNDEDYQPVKCTVCSTEVAVMDCDHVFHFFNVLASPP